MPLARTGCRRGWPRSASPACRRPLSPNRSFREIRDSGLAVQTSCTPNCLIFTSLNQSLGRSNPDVILRLPRRDVGGSASPTRRMQSGPAARSRAPGPGCRPPGSRPFGPHADRGSGWTRDRALRAVAARCCRWRRGRRWRSAEQSRAAPGRPLTRPGCCRSLRSLRRALRALPLDKQGRCNGCRRGSKPAIPGLCTLLMEQCSRTVHSSVHTSRALDTPVDLRKRPADVAV